MGRKPPARKPSFMKILFNDFSKKLLIPPKFVRLHRGTLARKCILRPSHTQEPRRVRTKQINNFLYFEKGWEKFAEHHSLQFGDMLIFRYAQDSEFYVDMFDKSCCSKEPVTSQNVKSRGDDTARMIPRKIVDLYYSKEKNVHPKTPALNAAEEFMASSEFPAFNKVMHNAYVRSGGYVALPQDFAAMHMKEGTREVKIEVSDKTWTIGVVRDRRALRLTRCWGQLAMEKALKVGDHVPVTFIKKMNVKGGANKVKLECSGKEWDAVINIHGYFIKISKGWATFAKENSLHIGDACVLELISREEAVIRVTTFKCTNKEQYADNTSP